EQATPADDPLDVVELVRDVLQQFDHGHESAATSRPRHYAGRGRAGQSSGLWVSLQFVVRARSGGSAREAGAPAAYSAYCCVAAAALLRERCPRSPCRCTTATGPLPRAALPCSPAVFP